MHRPDQRGNIQPSACTGTRIRAPSAAALYTHLQSMYPLYAFEGCLSLGTDNHVRTGKSRSWRYVSCGLLSIVGFRASDDK